LKFHVKDCPATRAGGKSSGVERHAFQKWREKLFAMKRDWLDFIAEAEARGA
jgi:hypothetical protein